MLQLASLLDEPVEVIISFKAKSLFQVICLNEVVATLTILRLRTVIFVKHSKPN